MALGFGGYRVGAEGSDDGWGSRGRECEIIIQTSRNIEISQ